MLAKAETKQRREKKLEHFFREAYALTFGLRPGEKRRGSNDTTDGEVNSFSFANWTPISVFNFLSGSDSHANVADQIRICQRIRHENRRSFCHKNVQHRGQGRGRPHILPGVPGHCCSLLQRENRRQIANNLRHVRQRSQWRHRQRGVLGDVEESGGNCSHYQFIRPSRHWAYRWNVPGEQLVENLPYTNRNLSWTFFGILEMP